MMKKKKAPQKIAITFPDRKISETFLDFSSPLLDTLGEAATKEKIEKILQITYTVWNAVVIDAVKGNPKFVSMIRESTNNDLMVSAMIEQLITRKNELFYDDFRMIGEYSVVLDGREWRLRADARDPLSIP